MAKRYIIILTIALLVSQVSGAYAGAGDDGRTPPRSPITGVSPESAPQGAPPRSLDEGDTPFNKSKVITPYGDFCPRCSKYGMGRVPVRTHEATEAVRDYFGHKGLTVKDVRTRGRFMRFDIYKGDSLVDKVIFDRRTGRIRSIY